MELPVHLISYLPSDCFSNILLLLGSYPSGLKSILCTKRFKLQSVDFPTIAAAGLTGFAFLKIWTEGKRVSLSRARSWCLLLDLK